MLTKAKALYQVKLILDYLPEEEYRQIPQEMIDYIEENLEYDENITINPNIPLEEQKIDSQTYKILEKIVEETEKESKKVYNDEIAMYVKKVKESNQEFDTNMENIKLKKLIDLLQKENKKIPKAKDLLQEYKSQLKTKDKEIIELKNQNEELKNMLNKIPRVIKKIFIK